MHFVRSFLVLVVVIAASSLCSAGSVSQLNEVDGLPNKMIETIGHQDYASDKNKTVQDPDTQPSIEGRWRIDATRTNEANEDARKKMNPQTIAQLNSMTMKLDSNGQFEQAMGADHIITGSWKFKVAELKKANTEKHSGRLTLVPDNLERHADMHFDILFIEPDLIEANPPAGVGIVYFKKEGKQQVQDEQQSKQDKITEAFAEVPGCLGARSMEQNGVQISFVWFEDRESIVSWCTSQKHMATAQQVLKMADPEAEMRKPLEAAPDEQGPFLVIMTLKPKTNRNEGFPLEQLSMEIYKPVDGGMFIGKRFAPEKLDVAGLREIPTK